MQDAWLAPNGNAYLLPLRNPTLSQNSLSHNANVLKPDNIWFCTSFSHIFLSTKKVHHGVNILWLKSKERAKNICPVVSTYSNNNIEHSQFEIKKISNPSYISTLINPLYWIFWKFTSGLSTILSSIIMQIIKIKVCDN